MLLTGLKGTGKTMTCNILKDSAKDCNVSMIKYGSVSPDVFMMQICSAFGLEFEETDRKELFGRVMEYFVDEYKDGKNNLIIIDEAENISDENLELLSSFLDIEIEKCKLVQVIISGCPELHDRLKQIGSELGPKFTFTVELAPLNLQDTTEYVEHRLKTAIGDDDVHLFKHNSYAEIYSYSKGIPSEINRIAHKALAIAKEKKQGKITPGHIRMAAARLYGVKVSRRMSKFPVAVIVTIMILTAGGFYYKETISQTVLTAKNGEPVKEPASKIETPEQEVMQEKPETPPAEAEQKVIEEEAQQETSSVVESGNVPLEEIPAETEEEVAVVQPEPEPEPAPAPEPEPVPEPEAPKILHGCITAQSGLKIREGASVNTELIGTAPYMAYIELVERSSDGKWWKTMYEGSYGYMYAKYIRVVDSPEDCRSQE